MKGYKFFSIIVLVLVGQCCFGQIEKDLFKSYGGNANNCYGNTMVPSIYDTIAENVVTKAAYTYLRRIPPVYDTIIEKILVRPGYTRYEVVEPLFDIEVKKIKIHDQDTELNTKAAPKSKIYSDRVQILPMRKIWTKTKKRKNCKSRIPENCLTWEVKELPSEYISVNREVPSTTLNNSSMMKDVPAQYVTIQKKILKREGSIKEVDILPEYRTIRKLKMRAPARYEEVRVPAVYKEIKRVRIITKGGTIEPQEVLCERDYGSYILPIQLKLQQLGYDIIELDGVLGKKTKTAVINFQLANNLPIGQLDFATIKKLGLMK